MNQGGLILPQETLRSLVCPLTHLASVLLTKTTVALMCLAQIAFQFYLYPYVNLFIQLLIRSSDIGVLSGIWGKSPFCVFDLVAGI
jgi:hypothetical protein